MTRCGTAGAAGPNTTRTGAILLLLALGSAVSAPGAAAQDRPDRIRVVPQAGWMHPLTDLASIGGGSQASVLEIARVQPGFMVGAAAEMELAGPLPALRARVLHAPAPGLERRTGLEREYEPWAGASMTVAVLDLLFRFPRMGPVRPYVASGAGIKSYRFDGGDLSDDALEVLGESGNSGTLHLGVGTEATVGRVGVLLEAGNAFSTFDTPPREIAGQDRSVDDDQFQADLLFTLGIGIVLR